MSLDSLARGLLLGVAIAAPVGPIGVLCIQRTLRQGFAAGLATGLGAATADACYGLLGASGLAGLGQAVASAQRGLALAGGAWLAWLGWRTLRASLGGHAKASGGAAGDPDGDMRNAAAATGRAPGPVSSAARAYASALGLTLANPVTILSFAAMFAGLGLPPGYAAAAWLVLGVLLGSAAWWLLLAGAVARIGHALGERTLRALDVASGMVLLAFAAWAIARAAR